MADFGDGPKSAKMVIFDWFPVDSACSGPKMDQKWSISGHFWELRTLLGMLAVDSGLRLRRLFCRFAAAALRAAAFLAFEKPVPAESSWSLAPYGAREEPARVTPPTAATRRRLETHHSSGIFRVLKKGSETSRGLKSQGAKALAELRGSLVGLSRFASHIFASAG